MSEHETRPEHEIQPRPAPEPEGIDWRRLEVALGRFGDHIAGGMIHAKEERRELDDASARYIAVVLGRALGRASALADFGRTGEGEYARLRDEYLDLYNHPQADHITKELVDWFGTYLVARENLGSGRRFMNEHQAPKLDRLLVREQVFVRGQPFIVHFPASLNAEGIDALCEELTNLGLDENEALQAFLQMPDVDANSPMLMESFGESYVDTYMYIEDAVRDLAELDELETEVGRLVESRGVPDDAIEINYGIFEDHVREVYDFVDWGMNVHVFNK